MGSRYYSEERRRDSDVYLPEIKRLLVLHMLKVTPDWIDVRYAADLMLLSTKHMMIAARVRNPRRGMTDRHSNQNSNRSPLITTELA